MKFFKPFALLSLACSMAFVESRPADDEFFPKGRPFTVIADEIVALQNDIAFLKSETDAIKVDLGYLLGNFTVNTDSIQSLESRLDTVEGQVNDMNVGLTDEVKDEILALNDTLAEIETNMTALEGNYTEKINEIESQINDLQTEIQLILEIMATKTDLAAMVSDLAEISAIQVRMSSLESFKEDYESMIQDMMTNKLRELEGFDARVKFLLDITNVAPVQQICIWDAYGNSDGSSGCTFSNDACASNVVTQYAQTKSVTFAALPTPEGVTVAGIDVYISSYQCDGYVCNSNRRKERALSHCTYFPHTPHDYEVFLNGVKVGDISSTWSCTCQPPEKKYSLLPEQITSYFNTDQDNTIMIVGSNPDGHYNYEAEYYAEVKYDVL